MHVSGKADGEIHLILEYLYLRALMGSGIWQPVKRLLKKKMTRSIPLLGQDTPRTNPCLSALQTIQLGHATEAVGTSGYAVT